MGRKKFNKICCMDGTLIMNHTVAVDLDAFVELIDKEFGGNLRDPRVQAQWHSLNLQYRTEVDESINPFSDAYFQSQIKLYNEISGRQLDQESGELHPVDVESLIDCPNPQGLNDVAHVSENVRTLSSMLSLACLRPNAHILDLGAGHGVSSEVYAFCGARVHAVDIDPELSKLAVARAAKRSLHISRSVMNFDSLLSLDGDSYDAAFFFQSLHHCLRPWELIKKLKLKLVDHGVIGFCGEPIQDGWRHWGLRLDLESVYVARKFGWFESGWSLEFIEECFRRNGMELILVEGGLRGGHIGLAAGDPGKLCLIRENAEALGFKIVGSRGRPMKGLSGSPETDDHIVDFKKAEWPSVILRASGLYGAESWGTWSVGDTVTLEFAETFPKKFAVTLIASAFGPNIGKEFVICVGETGKRFTLKESYEKRVFEFSNLEKSAQIQIMIPAPASPKSIGMSEDPRNLGIGLVEMRIVPL